MSQSTGLSLPSFWLIASPAEEENLAKMTTFTSRARITRFSLPAEPSAASVLRRFVREIARGTNLSLDEITDLQLAVTEAFNNALAKQTHPGEGRIALKIDARVDEIIVDLAYRETHFPPAEYFSRS